MPCTMSDSAVAMGWLLGIAGVIAFPALIWLVATIDGWHERRLVERFNRGHR